MRSRALHSCQGELMIPTVMVKVCCSVAGLFVVVVVFNVSRVIKLKYLWDCTSI